MIVLNDRSEQNLKDCINIAKELFDFFNDEGIKKMSEALKNHDTYMSFKEGELTGFATIDKKSDLVAEISWIAVDRKSHRNCTGSTIIEYISKDLKEKGLKLLEVKTLSHVEDYEPYERTRAFYRKNGFILLETIDPYPEWGEGNPCDIYVKTL